MMNMKPQKLGWRIFCKMHLINPRMKVNWRKIVLKLWKINFQDNDMVVSKKMLVEKLTKAAFRKI